MTTKFFPLVLSLTLPLALPAASLTEATFSQVIKDVNIVSMETRASAKAKLGDAFKTPDVIRTGPDSLAELMAPDKTVTRVGANTAFSFEKTGRAINLEQGSVLFHSPKGKGGGTIRTKAASAAVLGTTIVVTATAGGGFKAIVLEGKGQITLPNGNFRILQAGQVTFVLPGARQFGPQLNINLSKLVENSRLVQGFATELPSAPVIREAIVVQLNQIKNNDLAKTPYDLAPGQSPTVKKPDLIPIIPEPAIQKREDRLAIAKGTDLQIDRANQMTSTADAGATAAHLFLDPVPFDVPTLGSLNFSGVVGQNITIASTVTALDFTAYLNQTDFNIGATKYLYVQSMSLQLFASLTGTPLLQDVRLAGKSGLTIPSGASISAFHIGNLHLLTDGTMSLNNVNFENSGGQLHLNAGTVLDLTGGGISRTPSTLLEGATVSLNGGSYNVTGTAQVSAYGTELNTSGFTTLNGNIVNLQANTSSDLHDTTVAATTLAYLRSEQDVKVAGGSYSVSGGGGNATVSAGRDIFMGSSPQFQANTIQMNAARDATLTGVQARGFATLNVAAVNNLNVASGSFTGASAGSSTATLTAGNRLDLNGTAVAQTASISLSALTVNISNVNFPGGSMVYLYSRDGTFNNNGFSIPGAVNFLSNVLYNNQDATGFVNLINPTSPTIFVAARH